MSGAAAGVAAAAAAKKRRMMQEEEESLTTYNSDDLDGWEFKIVRSATGAFKKRDVVEKLCQEEARAGWEMVEKFDNSRIRFKRRTDRRAQDSHLEFDPYRISYGMGEGKIVVLILGLVFGVLAAVLVTLAALGVLD